MTDADRLRIFAKTLVSEAKMIRYMEQDSRGKAFKADLPTRHVRTRVVSLTNDRNQRVYSLRRYINCPRPWAGVLCRRRDGHRGLCTAERHAVENAEIVRSY
jgi:hypothetical protein